MSQGEFLLYQTEDARTNIQVRFQEGGLWLTQQQLADLYQSTPQNVTQHIRAIYESGELREEATCKPYLQVRNEGHDAATLPARGLPPLRQGLPGVHAGGALRWSRSRGSLPT